MEYHGVIGGIYRACEWVMRLAYINILWILFTLLGLILLGVMPATISVFTVIRKWLREGGEFSVFRLFWGTYKQEFIKGNLLAILLLVIGYILYIDWIFLLHLDGLFYQMLNFGLIMLIFMYGITILYIIPVYVHYDLKVYQYLRAAFIAGFSQPIFTITMMMGVGLFYYLLILIPGLIPFFSMSVFGLMTMWIANLSFTRIENKREELNG